MLHVHRIRAVNISCSSHEENISLAAEWNFFAAMVKNLGWDWWNSKATCTT
jgi:hypothetical protein